MRNKLLLCEMFLIVFVAGCSGDGGGGPSGPSDPAPATATVTTSNTPPPRFIPLTARVAVGGTVTWQNTSPAPNLHNIVWAGGAFPASSDLEAGDTHQITFAQAGDFDYQCLVHNGMTGRIVVE
ncbi:MAG: cupredoxin domain-containing protein [Gemmatimonadota bacterium]